MSSLLSVAECRAMINTDLTDEMLLSVIERAETLITNRIGAAQDENNSIIITEKVKGGGEHLFTKVPFLSVETLTEDGHEVDIDEFEIWPESGMVEKCDGEWGDVCLITYKPADMRSERKQAAIDLVRLMLERTAMINENVAGEFSYTAPNWEAAQAKILRRLCFGDY